MNLKAEQQSLYELLHEDTRCFVRMCDDDRALWVSDLPRRIGNDFETSERLQKAGFSVCYDAKNGLWYIDWTSETWQRFLAASPDFMPAFPSESEYHEIYALCRLWLLHPAPFDENQLPILRRIVKLTAQPKVKMVRAARSLYEEASVQLRLGESVCSTGGRVLAFWLCEQMTGKETRV